jgi:AraC family transcriptional regulator
MSMVERKAERVVRRRIGMLRDGRPCYFGVGDPPVWTSAASDWGGFLLEGHTAPVPASIPRGTTYFANPLVLLYTGGQAVLTYRIGSRTYQCGLAPGVVRVLFGEYELTSLSWSAPHAMLVVDVASTGLSPGLLGDDDLPWGGLGSHIATQDPQVGRLVGTMKAEVEAGCPAGRLFAESLSASLAAYLRGRFAKSRRAPRSRLSRAEIARVIEYIDANLSANLALTELAGTVSLSPHHFSSVFKNTFGISPYQFVIRRRVERAKVLLVARRTPIAEIASAVGFSSQSHFTTAFRKATGATPRTYRD